MLASRPPWLPSHAEEQLTPAQRNGLRHERAVNQRLEEVYGDWYVPGPWFQYSLRGMRRRFCQPDGLLFSEEGRITIIEAKLAHTARAWKQLAFLYRPVIEAAFPPWQVVLLEVVRWYRSDSLTGETYPVGVKLVRDAGDAEAAKFNVMMVQELGHGTRPDDSGCDEG